jgi:hypothetical protein
MINHHQRVLPAAAGLLLPLGPAVPDGVIPMTLQLLPFPAVRPVTPALLLLTVAELSLLLLFSAAGVHMLDAANTAVQRTEFAAKAAGSGDKNAAVVPTESRAAAAFSAC